MTGSESVDRSGVAREGEAGLMKGCLRCQG